MQPLTGLHIASLIDRSRFDVEIYHEDWHGPYDTSRQDQYALVFVTGLQADFDRMRQLSFHFRRQGATVIAGGNICTLFPEFASRFFDAVCAGGVDAVPAAIADHLNGALKPVYTSPSHRISRYELDYGLLTQAGISTPMLLIEASRGCSFRCSFCVIPAEGARHASYELATIRRAIDNAIAASPRFSLRRLYPMVFFYDNNFADDRQQMIAVAEMLREHPRIRAWAALVTQNVLHDRELVRQLAARKCRGLFVGLESLDREFLKRYNKMQNLSRQGDIVADILYAETQGVAISYGCLLDPRLATADQFRTQIDALVGVHGFPAPTFFSLVSPLVGTASFWEDVEAGELLPGLKLRDLDGETIAYRRLEDSAGNVAELVDQMVRKPWRLVRWSKMLSSNIRRVLRCGRLDPFHWYVLAATHLHSYLISLGAATRRRSFLPGDVLDLQYDEHPADISPEDWRTYFEPIQATGADGGPADWLKPYAPSAKRSRASAQRTAQEAASGGLHGENSL
jgi:hypothetical protein